MPICRTFCRIVAVTALLTMTGCLSQMTRVEPDQATTKLDPAGYKYVRDLARPWGVKWVEVEGVALVVGLDGTGSDPSPSSERSMLIKEMQRRKVDNPDKVLRSSDTSIALVRALLPPGVQKGDRIDVDVRIPAKCDTTSLGGGWAMTSRLREYALLNRRLSAGHELAMCQGAIMVESQLEDANEDISNTRGRILGGAVALESRQLGLRVRDEHLSVKTSSRIGAAVNDRFFVYVDGEKTGVAVPKRDSFIELSVHPRYRKNILRYVRVIQNIPVRETSSDLVARLSALETRLQNPPTAAEAALQLEAIGLDAADVLRSGLASSNLEVRFYAAEALAYMNDGEAAATLAEAAQREPAFRWRALAALAAMDDMKAHDELVRLLDGDSAETRYGAFRALREMTPNDPVIEGQVIGMELNYHVLDTQGDPLIHISKADRPEVVVFGGDQPLQHPVSLFAGDIVVKGTANGQIKVAQISADDDGQQLLVGSSLTQVVHAVVEVGGGYPEVVDVIHQAKAAGALTSRVAAGAVPQPGRKYYRDRDSVADKPLSAEDEKTVRTALQEVDEPVTLTEVPNGIVGGDGNFQPVLTTDGPAAPSKAIHRRVGALRIESSSIYKSDSLRVDSGGVQPAVATVPVAEQKQINPSADGLVVEGLEQAPVIVGPRRERTVVFDGRPVPQPAPIVAPSSAKSGAASRPETGVPNSGDRPAPPKVQLVTEQDLIEWDKRR